MHHQIVHGKETVGFLVSSIERESEDPNMAGVPERMPSSSVSFRGHIRDLVDENDEGDRNMGPNRSSMSVFEDSRRASSVNFHSSTRRSSNMRDLVDEKDGQERNLGPKRSSVRVFGDSRRVSSVSFRSSTEMGSKRSSLAIEGSLMSTGRRRRRRVKKEPTYFLDDEEEDDAAMSTQMDSTFKDELSHLRCMFGIAKGFTISHFSILISIFVTVRSW